MKSRLSIIICTKYCDLLRECLNSVLSDLSVTCVTYEIIIVAHKSTSLLTSNIMKEFVSRTNKIQYVMQDGDGLPNARNHGLKIASGETIVFLDDDVIVGQGYFSEIKRLMSQRNDIGGISGTFKGIYFVPHFSRIKRLLDKIFTNGWYGQGGPIGKVFPNGVLTYNFEYAEDVTKVDILSGSNMIYPRSVIDECGWFDENFGSNYAAYEDVDYSFRVTKHGYSLLVDPNLKLEHLNFKIKPSLSSNRIYDSARNSVYFFFKNLYACSAVQVVSFVIAQIYLFFLNMVAGIAYGNALAGITYLRGFLNGLRYSRFKLIPNRQRHS
jgi:glucosyl-dolichyl phosphate glucuronosyltransferase